jgi:flavin reductase (DIM6/NTAB) family NADH-FMN oxidoreductase RutF
MDIVAAPTEDDRDAAADEREGSEVSDRDREDVSGPLVKAVDYPLYVITAGAEEEVSGCLAGFITQSSIKPVQFLICISKLNHTHGTAQRSAGLGLHALGEEQHDVAAHFGELTGDEVDKFEGIRWSPGRTGVPILAECAAWVEGPIIGRMDGGDHEAFLIKVEDGGPGDHHGCLMLKDESGMRAGHPE